MEPLPPDQQNPGGSGSPGQPYSPGYPTGAQQPYGGPQQPYGGAQQPYGGPQQPYGGHQAQYPAQAGLPHAGPPHSGPPPKRAQMSGFAIVAIVLGVVVLLGGLGVGGAVLLSGTGETQDGGTGPAAPPVSAPSARSGATSIAGTWEGAYQCAQGRTRLRLLIKEQQAGATSIEAVFSFSPHPSNPGTPSGSYEMGGSYADGSLELSGVRWIDEPEGYIMVGLSAKITGDRPTRIRGTVRGSGCSVFSVERQP
jgi:hypothetical protein